MTHALGTASVSQNRGAATASGKSARLASRKTRFHSHPVRNVGNGIFRVINLLCLQEAL